MRRVYLDSNATTPLRPEVLAAAFEGAKERTILVHSLSKTYAMTGWRIGYLAAPEAVIEHALKASQNSITCVAPFVQKAAALALVDPVVQEAAAEMRATYARRRALVLKIAHEMESEKVLVTPPQGAFYFFLDFRPLGMTSLEICERILEEAGVGLVAEDHVAGILHLEADLPGGMASGAGGDRGGVPAVVAGTAGLPLPHLGHADLPGPPGGGVEPGVAVAAVVALDVLGMPEDGGSGGGAPEHDLPDRMAGGAAVHSEGLFAVVAGPAGLAFFHRFHADRGAAALLFEELRMAFITSGAVHTVAEDEKPVRNGKKTAGAYDPEVSLAGDGGSDGTEPHRSDHRISW